MLLGHAYDMAIDMWSLGCMAAELFLGLPLFPGASEHDLLVRIVDMLGMPPDHVLQKAQHTNRCPHSHPPPAFASTLSQPEGKSCYAICSPQAVCRGDLLVVVQTLMLFGLSIPNTDQAHRRIGAGSAQ